MNESLELLGLLGVTHFTKRHLNTVDEFLSSGETDAKKLLDQLGGWDESDLVITERFLKNLKK